MFTFFSVAQSSRGKYSIKLQVFSSNMDPQQQNNGFGPLSKPRGNFASFASSLVILISGAVHFKMTVSQASGEKESKHDKLHFLIFGASFLTLSLVLSEVVRRLCLVIEEIRHKQTRYEGSLRKVFNSTFTFRYGGYILLVGVVSLLVVSYFLYAYYDTFCRSEYVILFTLNCFLVPHLLFLVGFRELSIVEVSQINERENKNVADGLAWSYYFGYLKLVLPNLEDQIGKSMEYRYKITKKKLFILLPKTCLTYATVLEADTRIKIAGNLDEYKIDRGGIQKRSYKHTVHKIEMPRPDGKIDEYHVVLEYATPLMSLYDMSKHAECGLSRQERDEQVVLFHRKLKEILDGCGEKLCKGKYQLVPISGEGQEIADVLVRILNDENLELDEGAEAE